MGPAPGPKPNTQWAMGLTFEAQPNPQAHKAPIKAHWAIITHNYGIIIHKIADDRFYRSWPREMSVTYNLRLKQ
ncbi:hypothetical protein VN97_g5960 [Penicillium thymicola]|uniref:Uncharacterized protein n=1 Tax=Penicillium thymicola TaxID=293382 RepID=A0AAI9THA9_PENTH|nr:hypothetical protein VN97_g5960 [Penicillium thymicola]